MKKDLIMFLSVVIGSALFYGLFIRYAIRVDSLPWYSILAAIIVTAALIVSVVVFVRRQ